MSIKKPSKSVRLTRRGFVAATMASVVGCNPIIKRTQSPDDVSKLIAEKDPTGTVYVGDIVAKWGLNFYKVEGIGVVTQLDGTGSDPSPSPQRTYVMDDLLSRRIPKPKEFLAGKDTTIVVARGFMPPGIQKGERFDIEVALVPRSETTSLQGGYMMQTPLMQFEFLGRSVKTGHTMGQAKGPIIVDSAFEEGGEIMNRRGRIIGGGIAVHSRPLGLVVRGDSHSVRTSATIARRINDRFHAILDGGKAEVAEAKNDRKIDLIVPRIYRKNIGRYLAVAQNVAYKSSQNEISRIERLIEELNEPSLASRAALRLEGIGPNAIGALQRGSRSNDMEVKFYSAEALAYLGESEAASILGSIAGEEPAFRWRTMTALATMDNVESGIALNDLLHSNSAETRYGAFRALHYRSPMDPTIRQQQLPTNEFAIHLVPSEGPPMIHFAKTRRAEIVLFGHDQKVADEFLFIGKGITIKHSGNNSLNIKLYNRKGDQTSECSTQVADLMRRLIELGIEYDELLEVFRQAKSTEGLNSSLVIDATPKTNRRYRRNTETETAPDESNRYIAGPLPELFRTFQDDDSENRDNGVVQASAEFDEVAQNEAPPKESFLSKMKKKWSHK